MSGSNVRQLYVSEKRNSSHITASFNLTLERGGLLSRMGWASPFLVELFGQGVSARAPFRSGGPKLRHPKEMPLQSRATDVAHQLHTICCQANALKLMPSQIVRLEHGAPL